MTRKGYQPSVLHVHATEFGARTLLTPQMNMLADLGYEVRLACSPEDLSGRFHEELARFRPVSVPFVRRLSSGLPNAARGLVSAVRQTQPDLIHLHSPAAALTARMLPRRALGPDTRIVHTVHGFPFLWENRDTKSWTLRSAEWVLSHRTDLLLFQSAEDAQRARSGRFGAQQRYLGNGVEDYWFELAEPEQHESPLRLLFIGRVTAEKGVAELLEAVRRVPDVTVSIAGGRIRSERDDLNDLLDSTATDPSLSRRISLLGVLDSDAIPGVMETHDVLVLPSHREGVPRSVIEAMAAARPVIATDVRGCRELVDHGRTGLLVPAREPVALGEAISQMRDMPPERRREMGRAGRQRADLWYRESQVLERLLDAYSDLGLPPPRPRRRRITQGEAAPERPIEQQPVFILSLDCEGKWGMVDSATSGHAALLTDDGLRWAYGRLLEALDRHGIPATFALVGLFASAAERFRSQREILWASQAHRPWLQMALDAQRSDGGSGWHYPGLIEEIAGASTKHEIASHSYTHLPFDGDAVGRQARGLELSMTSELFSEHGQQVSTMVFPRNAVAGLEQLAEAGVLGYRDRPDTNRSSKAGRAKTLLDEANILRCSEAHPSPVPPVAIPAGTFLNWRFGLRSRVPASVTEARIRNAVAHAERTAGVTHLWLHPHNLITGRDQLSLLDRVLAHVAERQDAGALQVVTQRDYCVARMQDVTSAAARA